MTITTLTLAAFLSARLDDDEAVARAATVPAHDGYKPHPDLAEWSYEPYGEVKYVQTPEMLAHRYPEPYYVTCGDESPSVDESVGPHIARHDPARVLADVEAKRHIVELLVSAEYEVERAPEGIFRNVAEMSAAGYRAVVRLLALPFADHPDYDERWRAVS